MSQKIVSFCLGALLVSMVTGAPVASSDQQADSAVDIEKRADERIVYGNQQNRARVVNKRADLDLASDKPALGEVDEGSEVIVHKETSVEKDLAERADAARKDFEDHSKIADAMEAAMESVDNAGNNLEEQSDKPDASEQIQPEQTSSEASDSTADDIANSGDMEGAEGEESDETETGEDADIKDLLQVTGEGHDEGQATEQTAGEESSEQAGQGAEGDSQAEQYPQASAGEESGVPEAGAGLGIASRPGDNGQLGDFWRQMYQYMDAYPASARLPFDLYRGRRSLAGSKRAGSRRIKRDLLDDVEYDPEWIRYLYSTAAEDGTNTPSDDRYEEHPSSVLDMGDSLISDPNDYVPLTESDAEDLYSELEEYLQWELQRRAGAEKLRETLGLAPKEEDIAPQEAYNRDLASFYGEDAESGDDGVGESGLLDNQQLYPYGSEYPSDGQYYYAAKRNDPGRGVYDTEKRYFFPFADEPGTHWGAFVPEKREVADAGDERSAFLDDPYLDDYSGTSKRDYDKAIQRLQRLAMALSDNRGPYFTELVQDQPYSYKK